MAMEHPKKRPVEIDDLYRIRLVSDPQVSPDGATIAFVLTRLRQQKDDYAANIWLVPTDGSTSPRKFTGSDGRDTSPRWSPNGEELAFVSTRSGKPQIWVIPTGGGEARKLTRLKHGVQEIEWSPGGEWIAFTAKVEGDSEAGGHSKESNGESHPDNSENRDPGNASEEGLTSPQARTAGEWEEDDQDEESEEKGDKGKDKSKDGVRLIERLHYKADGVGYLDGRSHLFVVKARGGKVVQITQGEWDVSTPRWSPDGRIAYLTNKEADSDYRNIQDVFVVNIDDTGKPSDSTQATRHNLSIRGMDWLPDGDGFCVLGHQRLDEAAYGSNVQVWHVGMDGEARNMTEGWNRSASADLLTDLRSGVGALRPRFSPDGRLAYFMGMWGGSVRLFSVPLSGGDVREAVGGDRMLLNFDLSPHGLVFGASTAAHPNDLYFASWDGSGERQLTDVNRDLLVRLDVPISHEFWVKREDGTRLQGWYLLPPGFENGKHYPALLQIHGGPHTAYGSAYFHEFQVFAAQGFVVIYANPRGSQGYGQEFADAILSGWGGVDYDDLMACLDYVIGLGFVDADRLGVGGGSYGGYMSAWMIGQTQRFKAAVASRLVSNLYSAWGNGDFTWKLWNWEFQGTPQERYQLYIERSPVQHAPSINTPLLLTHAADDLRCNLEQAEQMYVALKVQKKPVKLAIFPSGGHDLSRAGKPSLRTERLRQIAQWYDIYLKPDV